MFSYTPSYSTQPAGPRARLLATAAGATTTVVTLPAESAAAAADALTRLVTRRRTDLHLAGAAHRGETCFVRRHLMAAVNGAPTKPAADLPAAGADLVAVATGLSDAERRALADEVGRLYADTEDILVPAALYNQYGDYLFAVLANGWLVEELAVAGTVDAAADYLLPVLDPGGDGYPLYEGLLAHLRGEDDEIDEAADRGWVDVDIDRAALGAWLRRHLPETADEVDEYLDGADTSFTAFKEFGLS